MAGRGRSAVLPAWMTQGGGFSDSSTNEPVSNGGAAQSHQNEPSLSGSSFPYSTNPQINHHTHEDVRRHDSSRNGHSRDRERSRSRDRFICIHCCL